MEASDALALLDSPGTRCQGARALAERGDRAAFLPLLKAYERGAEGTGVCLLEAMRDLGPVDGVRELFAGDAEARRLAVHLMELFPDDLHLRLLERALADPDAGVRRQALRSLRLQRRTDAWEALLVRLLASPQPNAATEAARLLAERGTPAARAALGEWAREERRPR
jgi:HEAT repeat protein